MKTIAIHTNNQPEFDRELIAGLPASGLFLINPPYTLQAGLKLALPQLVDILGQDRNATFALEAG